MNIRFVTQDMEWSEAMQSCVRAKIVEPLTRHLKSTDFELSVHIGHHRKRAGQMEMWVVLQTFDGGLNEVVRCEGYDFHALTNDVSSSLRARLRKKVGVRRRFLSNPFKFLPFEPASRADRRVQQEVS